MTGFASLEGVVGHSYADILRFINYEHDEWGRQLLESLWGEPSLQTALKKVALIDLLFESPDGATLYGFFAISKQLVPPDGKGHIETYSAMLKQLFANGITVGSHAVFRRGLPSARSNPSVLLGQDNLEQNTKNNNHLSENYLYGNCSVNVKDWSTTETTDVAEIFDYQEIRINSRELNINTRSNHSGDSIDNDVKMNWRSFLQEFSNAFRHNENNVTINMFAVPILTRDALADERATGALFFGEFVH